MIEKLGIIIENGRLKGPKIEKAFFGDAKKQLEDFWGLNDLNELRKTNQIYLPQQVADYIVTTTELAMSDGLERSAVLGFANQKPTIKSEVTGKQSFKRFIDNGPVKEINASVQYENSFRFSWNRLFGTPEPIIYHCHPGLTEDDLTTITVTLDSNEKIEIPVDRYLKFINSQAGTFSTEDLETFFQSNRYLNSALLGSSERIVYIAQSELYIQSGFARINRFHVEYNRAMMAVVIAYAVKTLGIPFEKMSQQKFTKGNNKTELLKAANDILSESDSEDTIAKARDQALIDVCHQAGYVAFASATLRSCLLSKLG